MFFFIGKHFTFDELWKLTKDLLSVLLFMQNKNMYHGDIKPSNIYVFENETYKLGEHSLFTNMNSFLRSLSGSTDFQQNYLSPTLIQVFIEFFFFLFFN